MFDGKTWIEGVENHVKQETDGLMMQAVNEAITNQRTK